MKKNSIFKFFDKLEDRNRAFLSRFPVLYALIGGVGIVLFWRGVWHTADTLTPLLYGGVHDIYTFKLQLIDSMSSLVISIAILLATGLLVTNFIGNRIIISGLKHEKKLEEKEVDEIESEEYILQTLTIQLKTIQKDMADIKQKLHS